jgi:hypothetical protein
MTQFFNIQQIIPVDINRARGLSRSTLNYSALMAIAYIAASNIKNNLSWALKILIFFGAIASLGRGGVIAIIIYEAICQLNKKEGALKIAIGIIIIVSALVVLKSYSSEKNEILTLVFKKYYYSLDFVNDPGNADRLTHYLKIKNEITFFGKGFGSTGPAAERFNNAATGFESYLLSLLYQGGFIFFIVIPILFYTIYKNKIKFNRNKYIAVNIAYLAMMAAQQTFETPCVNVLAWVVLLAIAHGFCMGPSKN